MKKTARMGFTIPKKGSQNQDESLPPVNEAPAPQVNIASQPPPEEKKSPPSRPATRGKLLPSAVNSKRSHIYIKSEKPFIIKINLSPVNYGGNTPSSSRGSPRQRRGSKKYSDSPVPSEGSSSRKPSLLRRSSSRSPVPSRSSGRGMKRKSSSIYVDDGSDTDSDDLMTSGEEAELEKKREKQRIARKKKKRQSSPTNSAVEEEEEVVEMDGLMLRGENGESIYDIESPPNGVISSLWYSREQFLHVFVLEKILAWKTRPVIYLEICEPPPSAGDGASSSPVAAGNTTNMFHSLDYDEAMTFKENAIIDTKNNFRKRMDVSRINPGSCPHIKKMAAKKELNRSKIEGLSSPAFKAVKSSTEREEVFLVKWRGRSYLHCSWERKRDLEKFDHSTQAGAARAKISRYAQNQALALGENWKKVLEDERKAAAMPGVHHAHHLQSPMRGTSVSDEKASQVNQADVEEDDQDEEDYFSPLHLEVERILGCDESELDMNVLSRQRAINLRDEQLALKKREEEDDEEERWLKGEALMRTEQNDMSEDNGNDEMKEWDPEDNVRYIVRWKGLQLTDITWEYWADIKRDFVDEVEDFWLRQKAPTPAEVNKISKASHPHPRDFKKMIESPIFGVSSVERPIAKLDDDEDLVIPSDKEDPGVEYKLRGYQLEGVNWLTWNWYNKRSCILADEMGLGKTIQSIGFLTQIQRIPRAHIRGPFLIVAPLSLVSQWESESKEWAPDMNVVVYHGSADARDFLVKNEFYYLDQFESKETAKELKQKHITKFQLLITTYEVVLKDVNVLSKIKWKALIVDEAHRLKNIKSRLFEDLSSVPRDFCLLLTGTPLQNSTEELWALLHFCDPISFASRDEFIGKFGQLQDSEQVANLHTVLRPFLLRRVKEDVEKALPPKEETILEVSLTPIQKQFYKAIYDRNTAFLFRGAKPSNAPSLMNVVMELRKCCNHPFLIRGAEDRIIDDAAENEKKATSGNNKSFTFPVDYAKLTGEQLVKSSGKFVLLSKLLPKLYSGGHKVLIFSQMVRVLDLLQELLQLNHYRYERLDGNTSASARNAAVDRFRRESFNRFVMLLSTRAGGLGLNLTAADTVIIFDSDWNPQNDLQAMARAHRIGQTRSVRVYRLLTAKTYEMHMFHSASLKLGLDRAVLAHQRGTDSEENSTKRKSKAEREEQAKEIDSLLKKGAYDVFNEDDDKEAQRFMETDIDQLLEKSSRKVTYGESATTSLASGLGSFSKASFVASGDGIGKDVDLDDPEFWSKAVGLEAPPEELDPTLALIIDDGSKRNRRQVQAFDPQAEEIEAERQRQEEIALIKAEEEEEREIAKLEKFLRKQAERDEKDKKIKQKQEAIELKQKLKEKRLAAVKDKLKQESKVESRRVKEVKVVYNERKTDRKRMLKRAEHEDPVFERVKQAWDTSQRNRAVNAILRFGFGRFCKVRHYSNFTSLPLQDVEVFARSYVYQLGLQVAMSLLSNIDCSKVSAEGMDEVVRESLRDVLEPWVCQGKDFQWICDSVLAALCMHMRVKAHEAFVRMPLCLVEPMFLHELRQGVAIRSLHRLSFLSRLNSLVEEAVDMIIDDLGPEELGRRGCLTRDVSSLDLDLKARHVTTEELLHALGTRLYSSSSESIVSCAPWWDWSCDIGIVVGTFIHGLGNYDGMRKDEELPFLNRMKSYVQYNEFESESYRRFDSAADAAKRVFDKALETMKIKFQQQTTAAVAAVIAANKNSGERIAKEAYQLETQKMDADDVISLPRIKIATLKSYRRPLDVSKSHKKEASICSLPLPDATYLDRLLVHIVEKMESCEVPDSFEENPLEGEEDNGNKSVVSRDITMCQLKSPSSSMSETRNQVLFAGGLSGSDKRPQDHLADYFLGAASSDLASISVGADSSRYQRGPNVPLLLTRFALGGILQAEDSVIDILARGDRIINCGLSRGDEKTPTNGDSTCEATDVSLSERKVSDDGREVTVLIKKQPHWNYVKSNTDLRSSICVNLLQHGLPGSSCESSCVDAALWNECMINPALSFMANSGPNRFFSMKDAFGFLFQEAEVDWPEEEPLEDYLQLVLLPHCLGLCLNLAGEQTKNAAVQGKSDVYVARPAAEDLHPLPDPFVRLSDHSEQAVYISYAILRRVRLMKSIRFVVGGGVSFSNLTEFLRGPTMRKRTMGVPVWWCPWIHDLAILVHAALHGLQSVTSVLPKLQQQQVEHHVRETFVKGANGKRPVLPSSFLKRASEGELDAWVKTQAQEFPSPIVVEHRLALMCSQLTKDTSERFDYIPMFDEAML